MKTISLFSGCGGLDFGAAEAGATIVYANEIDQDSCETLRKYFPGADLDSREVKEVRSFPTADLVIGGYPCQSFSMGGNRNPANDHRTFLYLEFARCLQEVRPKYFVAENVSGLKKVSGGTFLKQQFETFEKAGREGYRITGQVLDAKDYGVPQTRKRMILVGVRRHLERGFLFPIPTHGRSRKFKPYTSHGEAIKHLPLWPNGEFYERPHDPEGHLSWYFMSRNRKAKWDGPAFTVVANWRHITIHPACAVMKLTWSNLADGWKQRWDFSDEYEHLLNDPERPVLKVPRRLSWRECAAIQTFPEHFEPAGDVESKFTQIGNAVPPLLAKTILAHLISGNGLVGVPKDARERAIMAENQLTLW